MGSRSRPRRSSAPSRRRRGRRHQGGRHRAGVSHGPDPREARVAAPRSDGGQGPDGWRLSPGPGIDGRCARRGERGRVGGRHGRGAVEHGGEAQRQEGEGKEDRAVLEGLVPELDQLATRLLELSQDDIDAYRAVIDARNRARRATPWHAPTSERPMSRSRLRRPRRAASRSCRRLANEPGR